MFHPAGLLALPLVYGFAWPLTDRLLGNRLGAYSPLVCGLVALSASTGILAIVLFWVGILPGVWLSGWAVFAVVAIGLTAGLALNLSWLAPQRWRDTLSRQWKRLARLDAESLLLWTIIGSLFVILINALYYPFLGDDTLSRYGLHAQFIYRSHRLPESVAGYPPLAPLVYAATWFAVGYPNEHLANLFPFLMAAGTLGATYLIGRAVSGSRTGLAAGALVAVTPLFVRNATLGYTDIPTTFPLMLASWFALRWWKHGAGREALAAGVFAGIALLTKQSAFTWLASLAAVPLLWWIGTRSHTIPGRGARLARGLAGMLLPPVLIALPWYARNWWLGGWPNVLPVAGLYHLEGPMAGWRGLLPPLAWPTDFGPWLVWVYIAGWLIGLSRAASQGWHLLQGRAESMPLVLLLAVMVVPYWLVWWLHFSFDARFLLLILPLMAVWSAQPLVRISESALNRVPVPTLLWRVGGGVALLGLLFFGVQDRLGGVYWAVTRPFAPETERERQVRGDLYDLAWYIHKNVDPSASRLMAMDGRLPYYLLDYDVTVQYPLTLADLRGYDYLVHSSSVFSVYNGRLGWNDSEFYRHIWDALIFEPVYESGGVHIMRVLRTDLPSLEEPDAVSSPNPEEP